MITAVELARRIGVDPKRLRRWLRHEALRGNPLVRDHEHGEPWIFSTAEADQLEKQFRSSLLSQRPEGEHLHEEQVTRTHSSSVPKVDEGFDFSSKGLLALGFAGSVSFDELRNGAIDCVPIAGGIYVVLWHGVEPDFVNEKHRWLVQR